MATFTLDSSALGGAPGFYFAETIIEERGRSLAIQWEQDGVDEGMELFGYSIRFAPAESEPKDG